MDDPFDELAGALNKRDQWLNEGGPPEVQAQKQQEDQKAEALPAVQSLRLEMAKRDSTVGKVQWTDESVPLQQRIGDFVQTHAVAEAQRKDKPDYDAKDWEWIAGQAQQFFPGVDAEKLKQPFLEGRQQAWIGQGLAAAKEKYQGFEEPGRMTLLREGLPFATTGWNFWEKSQYADAKQRLAKGEYNPGDFARVAHFEKLQENKQNESLGKSALRTALNVGTFAGEAWAGGAALKGVGILPTIRMGGAAVAETPTLAARLIGKTALTRTAAQTALMPSMWLPQSVDQAMQKGGNWSDLKNLGPAYGMGMMQVGLLGAASKAGGSEVAAKIVPGIAEGGVKGWATRLVTGTGVAMSGQAGIDVTNGLLTSQFPVWGHKGYGTAVDLAEGKEGAPKAMLMQLLTFALFNVGHAHNNPLGEARAADLADSKAMMDLGSAFVGRLKKAGYGEDAAYGEAIKAQKVLNDQIHGKDVTGAKASLSKMAQQYVDSLGERMKVDQLAAEQKAADMAARNPNVGQFRGQFGADQPTAATEGPVNVPESTQTPETAPPPKPGMVRLYHGGEPHEGGGTRWLTPDPEYAAGYARKSGSPVSYVDIPESSPLLQKSFDDSGTSAKAPYMAFDAPAELARGLKPFRPPEAPESTPAAKGQPATESAKATEPTPGTPESFAQRLAKGENPADVFKSAFEGKQTDPDVWNAIEAKATELNPDWAAPKVPVSKTVPGAGRAPPKTVEPAPESVFHITDYKTPSKSVGTAIDILARKGSAPRPLEVWDAGKGKGGREGFDANFKSSHVAFEFDTGKHTGEMVRGEAGKPQGRFTSTDPLRYNPGLKAIHYKGSEADLAFARLKAEVDDINADRADGKLMREYGHKEALDPVELKATEKASTKAAPEAPKPAEPQAEPQSTTAPVPRGTPEAASKAEPRPMTEEEFKAAHPEVLTPEDATAAVKAARRALADAGKSGLNTAPFAAKLKAAIDASNEVASRIRQKVGGDQTLPPEMEASINATKLTEQEKAAVVARVTDSDGLRPLADKMGVSHETVRKRALDGLAKLKETDPELWQDVKQRLEDLQTNALRQRAERQAADPNHIPDPEDPVVQHDLEPDKPRLSKLSPDELAQEMAETQRYLDDLVNPPDNTGAKPAPVRPEDQPGLRGQAANAGPEAAAAGTEGPAAQGNAEPATATPAAGREAASRELKFRTVAQEIQARGGIDPKSFAEIHGKSVTAEFFKEFRGIFQGRNLRGGNQNFENLVDDLVRHQVIKVPEGMKPTDAILELIKGRALDVSQNLDAKYQAEAEVYDRAQSETERQARQAGFAAKAVESSRALGREIGEESATAEDQAGSAEADRLSEADEAAAAQRPGATDFDPSTFSRPVRGVGPERPEPSDAVMEAATEFAKQEGGHVVPEAILSRAYDLAARIGNAIKFVQNNWREFAGNQFPRTARLGEDVAQKMVEWVHAKTAAIYGTPKYIDQILGPKATQATRRMAGAVETEWRLEYMHDAYQKRSADLIAQAQKTKAGPEYARLAALAQEARQDAANVGTIIGAKNSPLQTDAQFRAELAKPEHKEIQAKWEQHMVPEMEANFKKAMGLDPQDAIDSFTQRPGHPINLKNIGPNDPITSSAIQSIPRGPSRGNLGNVRQGRLGFSRQAKGTGTYDIDLGAIIANSLGKGLSAAGRAEALKAMIEEGVATVGEPFKTKEGYTEFKNTFPEAGNAMAEKGETSLYVKNESAGEYRQALQVDEAPKYPLIAGFNQVLTRAALASSVEFVYHGKNLLTFLFKPGVRLPDLLKNAYNVVRNTPEGQAQLFELAKAGRMKAPGLESGLLLGERAKSIDPTYHASRVLDGVQKIMRLTASDAFDRMSGDKADFIAEAVKSITGKYPFEKGELNKTNFINQLGQYNKRSQNSLLVLLRDTGISPFATAGTNYYVQSMRGLTGASGARTTGLGGEIASRGEYFAKVGAVLGTVAAINYFAWKRSDGDDDVPLGSIKVGEKNGKSQYLDLTSLTGLTRGARQTGMLAIAEGERAGGKKATEAAEEDKAFNNIVDSLLHPFVGPGAAAVHTAITGRNLAGYDIRQPASTGFDPTTGASQPKEGDARRNLAAAAWQANPALEVFRPEIQKKLGMAVSAKDKTAQQPVEDRAMKLLGPFGIKTKLGGRRR